MTIFDEYERMRAALEDVTGETLDTEHPRRTETQFWMRATIAHFLYRNGWNDDRIAGILGRNRTTIYCARQRLQQAMDLPRVYWDVTRMIEQFKTHYYELFGQNL